METQQKSWFGRNWLWVVPVGGCLTIIVLFVLGIGTLFFGISKAVKKGEPYQYALKLAQENDALKEVIGSPVETDGFGNTSVEYKNGTSRVDLAIPIKGPNGKATIIVKGEKPDEQWIYEKLYITIKDTNEQINMLDKVLDGI